MVWLALVGYSCKTSFSFLAHVKSLLFLWLESGESDLGPRFKPRLNGSDILVNATDLRYPSLSKSMRLNYGPKVLEAKLVTEGQIAS